MLTPGALFFILLVVVLAVVMCGVTALASKVQEENDEVARKSQCPCGCSWDGEIP